MTRLGTCVECGSEDIVHRNDGPLRGLRLVFSCRSCGHEWINLPDVTATFSPPTDVWGDVMPHAYSNFNKG